MKLINKYKQLPVQIKASLWFLICSFFQKGISFITTPIFTRLLSPSEYGNFNVFNSWLSIVTVLVTFNLSAGVYTQGLIKFEKEDKIKFTSSIPGLMTVLVAFWTLIYLIFHDFWNKITSLTTIQMLSMLIMIWTSSAFSFWSAEQRVKYKYHILIIITLIISIAKPVIGIIFVTNFEDKVTARILGLVLVEIIGYTGLYIMQMSYGKQFFSKKFWKYALLYNLPLVPHYFSQTILNSADRIMINDMIGEYEAGIYSLAYSVSMIMTLFNTSLSQTISPWFYQKIKENKIKDIKQIAYISLIIIAIVNIVLIAFAPEAVKIFAPKEYYDAIWVIPPVAMSVYFMFSYDLFAKFAFYYEKTLFVMIASVIGAVLNIILNYIFIRLFGYIMAGYTTLICYIIYTFGHYIFMNKICKECCNGIKPYNLKIYLSISLLFILIGISLLLTYKTPIFRYSFLCLCFILIIIFKNKIINIFKTIINLRKNNL